MSEMKSLEKLLEQLGFGAAPSPEEDEWQKQLTQDGRQLRMAVVEAIGKYKPVDVSTQAAFERARVISALMPTTRTTLVAMMTYAATAWASLPLEKEDALKLFEEVYEATAKLATTPILKQKYEEQILKAAGITMSKGSEVVN